MKDRIIPEIGFMGIRMSAKKWVQGKLNKAFLHFLPYLMIFQSFRSVFAALHFLKIIKHVAQNLVKKWRKALFNLPWTHFSMAKPETRPITS